MTALLPVRRKYRVFGPRIVEEAAVYPMRKATFLMCATVGVTDPAAGLRALNTAFSDVTWEEFLAKARQAEAQGGEREWTCGGSTYLELANAMRQHQNEDTLTYEDMFRPPIAGDNAIDQGLAFAQISTSALQGLMGGTLYMGPARRMIESWVSRDRGWGNLGAGGLTVREGLRWHTVDEVLREARKVFQQWESK